MKQIKSVMRSCQVLDLFSVQESKYTLSEIALKLSIPKSTVSRLVYTLESLGILRKSQDGKYYHLGKKIRDMAKTYLSNVE